MLTHNIGFIASYLWSIAMRLFDSILINQTPGGLMDKLSPPCKHYISGFIARSLVNKLNEEDKSMLMYSGRFVNELGCYKSCTSASNMAYYLIQAGADIVRVNVGVCFTQQCSPEDVQIFRNYLFTKLMDQINRPSSILYKTKDYVIFNIQQVEGLAKSIFTDPLTTIFYITLLAGLILVAISSLWYWKTSKKVRPARMPIASIGEPSLSKTFLASFAIQSNWQMLKSYNITSAEQLTIDFLRSLSYVGVLAMNIAYIEAELSKVGADSTTRNYFLHGFKHTALQGSLLIPDLFLMLGGYTATLSVIRVYRKVDIAHKTHLYPAYHALLCFKRFIRYTLALFLGMTFVWKILPRVADGPLKVTDLGCNRTNFWASVFLWNSNFAGNGRRMCGPWYWYPAVDFQLFLAIPFLCMLFVLAPKKALTCAGVLSILGLGVTAIYDQMNDIKAVNDHDVSWITNYMTISYLRSFPYLAGCTFAMYRAYKAESASPGGSFNGLKSLCDIQTPKLRDMETDCTGPSSSGLLFQATKNLSRILPKSSTRLYLLASFVGFAIFMINGSIFYFYFQAYIHNLGYPQWKHTLFNTFGPPAFGVSFLLFFGGFLHLLYPYFKKNSRPHVSLLVLRAVYFEVFIVGVPFVLWLYFSFQGIPWFANQFAYFNMVWVLATAIFLALVFYLVISRPYANCMSMLFRF
jgi:hypothetical protein